MRPWVVILGFVLGSAAAISFALVGTLIVFLFLRSGYPRLDTEIVPLVTNVGLFGLLTAAAAATFLGELKRRPWRRGALLAMLLSMAAAAAYHVWS